MTSKDLLKKGLIKANNFLGGIDHFFSAKTTKSISSPLFIVGVPRSGTTLTYQIITQQIKVCYFTAIMGYSYGIPNITNRLMRPLLGRPNPVFKSKFGNIKGFLSPSEHANYWFQWFPSDGKCGHYIPPDKINLRDYESLKRSIESITTIMQNPMVFKCLYLDMTVGTLAQIFPEARFLFVRRDHIMNCQSILSGRLKQKKPEEWWSVKPPAYKKLMSLPIWKQVTQQVFLTEKIITQDLKKYAAGRHFEVHYENICQNPHQTVRDITEWLKPIGFKAYQDIRIPCKFTRTNKKYQNKSMNSQIKKYFESLKQQETS